MASRKPRKERAKKAAPQTCCCGCGRPLPKGEYLRRGLIPACYFTARREIARGTTTWDELEAAGVAAPAGTVRSVIARKAHALAAARK